MTYFFAKNKIKLVFGFIALLLVGGIVTAVILLKPAPAPEPEPDKVTTISVNIGE